jgi:hypothetical protein
MNNTSTLATPVPKARFPFGWLVCGMLLLIVLLCGYGIVSFFQLGAEASVLQASLKQSAGGEWHKQIAINAGWFTTGLLRAATRFVHLPPEARTVLGAIHGAEVGIYRQKGVHLPLDFGAALEAADKGMRGKGWERVVGVVQPLERQLVAVYLPRKGLSPRRMKCCVMVVQREDLIIAGARGDLASLLSLAADRIHFDARDFALR